MYEKVMKAFFNSDQKMAYSLNREKKGIFKRCIELGDKFANIEHVPNIIEKLKIILNDVQNINRLIYN